MFLYLRRMGSLNRHQTKYHPVQPDKGPMKPYRGEVQGFSLGFMALGV